MANKIVIFHHFLKKKREREREEKVNLYSYDNKLYNNTKISQNSSLSTKKTRPDGSFLDVNTTYLYRVRKRKCNS